MTESGTALVWLEGKVLPAAQAWIAALDHGVTVGDGVFETCKVIDGRAFAVSRHLRRLARSADVLGLVAPPADVVRVAIDELLASAPPLPFGRLRITVTGGPGPLGSNRDDARPTLFVAVSEAPPWPDRIDVVTVPWVRNERSATAGAKTTSYAENVVALRRAHERDAHEALLANTRGELCEGTGSNVVVERGGVLVTPPLTSGCLAGITRELLLEWAADERSPLIEDVVTMAELAVAPAVLLTSSTRNVQRVAVLDGRKLASTPVVVAAVELFERRAADDVDP